MAGPSPRRSERKIKRSCKPAPFSGSKKSIVCDSQHYRSYAQVAILATLSSNPLFTPVLPQHRFHVVQAINSGAHLRLIQDAGCLGGRDLAPKIHLHLALLLGDDGLNDRRSLL